MQTYHVKHFEIPTGHSNSNVMVKLAMLKKVVLPNGRSFYATYKMVTQDALPNNVRIRRTYRIQAPVGPRSRWIKDVLVKGFRIAKRLATSSVGRERGKIAMEDAARAYETGVRRVRNAQKDTPIWPCKECNGYGTRMCVW